MVLNIVLVKILKEKKIKKLRNLDLILIEVKWRIKTYFWINSSNSNPIISKMEI